jgi:hypothetical protein
MTSPSHTTGEGWRDIANDRAMALGHLNYLPGSWDKRFARAVASAAAAGTPLSEKQAANVERLAWKYRRQLPARLVPPCAPVSA